MVDNRFGMCHNTFLMNFKNSPKNPQKIYINNLNYNLYNSEMKEDTKKRQTKMTDYYKIKVIWIINGTPKRYKIPSIMRKEEFRSILFKPNRL